MGYLGNDVVDMTLNFAHVINVTELRLLTDRMNADVVILDLTKTNFRSMTTLSPSLLAKFIAIVEVSIDKVLNFNSYGGKKVEIILIL